MSDEIQVTLPTVGRIMYYYVVYPGTTVLPTPRAFLVCGVNDTGTAVDGCLFSELGYPESAQGVPVVQPHEEIPFGGFSQFVMWMPYQVKAHAAA